MRKRWIRRSRRKRTAKHHFEKKAYSKSKNVRGSIHGTDYCIRYFLGGYWNAAHAFFPVPDFRHAFCTDSFGDQLYHFNLLRFMILRLQLRENAHPGAAAFMRGSSGNVFLAARMRISPGGLFVP